MTETITLNRQERRALYGEAELELSGIADVATTVGTPEGQSTARRFREAMALLDAIGWERDDRRDQFVVGAELIPTVRRYMAETERCVADTEQGLREPRDARQSEAEYRQWRVGAVRELAGDRRVIAACRAVVARAASRELVAA